MKKTLDNITLPAKFAILALFGLLLFSVPTWMFIQVGNQKVSTKLLELQGVPVEKEIIKLLNILQRHRAETIIAIAKNSPDTSARVALKEQINQNMKSIQAQLRNTGINANVLQRFIQLTAFWNQLQSDIDRQKLTLSSNLARHAEMIRTLLDINMETLDYYGLSLDPDLISYQLIMSLLTRLPELTETIAQIRASGTSLLSDKDAISASDIVRMEFQIAAGRNALALFNLNLLKSYESDSDLRAKFSPDSDIALKKVNEALKMAEAVFVKNSSVRPEPADYAEVFTLAINEYANFAAEGSDELMSLLSAQINQYRLTQFELLAGLLVVVMFVVVLGIYISRSITGPVNEAAKVASQVASGDLTANLVSTGTNEMAGLIQSLMKMRQQLALLVADIKDNAATIATSSEEIAKGNGDLSSRTEEQSASITQTAASMEQLSSSILQNAENTRHAAEMASQATNAALLGGEAMESVLVSMQKISSSAGQIEEIIGAIDNIAFQTNILALNAAVEAARAGEYGRGFAVVAEEVRVLAQSSASAAKDIKLLIERSTENVSQGISMAHNAGDKVKQSVQGIEQTARLVREISSTSQEQSAGVTQIKIAVNRMDQVTQHNAVMVEHSAASAEELAARAIRLRDVVAVFRTTESG